MTHSSRGTLLGEELDVSDPEIEATFQLLVDTWLDRQERFPGQTWISNWPEEDCWMQGDWWQLPDEFTQAAQQDPSQMKASWVSVMIYLMSHYSYLHE